MNETPGIGDGVEGIGVWGGGLARRQGPLPSPGRFTMGITLREGPVGTSLAVCTALSGQYVWLCLPHSLPPPFAGCLSLKTSLFNTQECAKARVARCH